jgi:hypothetical protein
LSGLGEFRSRYVHSTLPITPFSWRSRYEEH